MDKRTAARRAAARKAMRMKKLRRRRQIRMALMILAALAAAAIVLMLVLRPGNDAAPVPTPEPTLQFTAVPTPEPTVQITPEPTPEPTPHAQLPISLYAPDGSGVRHRLSEYVSKWTRGKDIDCFEALVSEAATLSGRNFLEIARSTWGTLPDPYAMHIGYTLRYTLADGSEIGMTITSPDDISHTEYLECYLYDDVHTKGFYTHLSEKTMKDNTLITSVKLTCGPKIDQVQQIFLGAFLYDSPELFDAAGNYTGPWYSEISIRRK